MSANSPDFNGWQACRKFDQRSPCTGRYMPSFPSNMYTMALSLKPGWGGYTSGNYRGSLILSLSEAYGHYEPAGALPKHRPTGCPTLMIKLTKPATVFDSAFSEKEANGGIRRSPCPVSFLLPETYQYIKDQVSVLFFKHCRLNTPGLQLILE